MKEESKPSGRPDDDIPRREDAELLDYVLGSVLQVLQETEYGGPMQLTFASGRVVRLQAGKA